MHSRKRRIYSLFIGLLVLGYSWVALLLIKGTQAAFVICPIKTITGFPCPSCGSTRSVLKLMQGDFAGAIYTNPFGILLFILAVLFPLWLLYDFWFKKETLWNFYNKLESIINQKQIAIPLILLVVANWIWNIFKGL